MLYNERYAGRIIWNRWRYVKTPGTNERVARPRPRNEWVTISAEHLWIVSEELWERVREQLRWKKRIHGHGRPADFVSRTANSPYLFSGLLVCSECGGKLTIVSGGRRKGDSRFGCPRHFGQRTRKNYFLERQDKLQSRLIQGLQQAV